MRTWLRRWLGIEVLEERVSDLETMEEHLQEYATEILAEDPVLQDGYQLLQERSRPRKNLMQELRERHDISRATAYRRIKELEEEYMLIREEDGQLHPVTRDLEDEEDRETVSVSESQHSDT